MDESQGKRKFHSKSHKNTTAQIDTGVSVFQQKNYAEWQKVSEVEKWMGDAFLDLEDNDVVVVFRDEKGELRLPAHRFVLLRSKSSELRKMLDECTFKEGSGVIELLGVDLQVGIHFLEFYFRFIYLRKFPKCSETELMLLIKAGDMYDLPQLVRYCDENLSLKVNQENCVYIHETIRLLSEGPKETKAACLKTIISNGADMLFNNLHLGMSSETFNLLLQEDDLVVSSENVIVAALWDWGKRQCSIKYLNKTAENVEKQLEPVAQNIRWGSVTTGNFDEPGLDEYVRKMKEVFLEREQCNRKRKAFFLLREQCNTKRVVREPQQGPARFTFSPSKDSLFNFSKPSNVAKEQGRNSLGVFSFNNISAKLF